MNMNASSSGSYSNGVSPLDGLQSFFENVVGHGWVTVGGCSRTGERKRRERAGGTRESGRGGKGERTRQAEGSTAAGDALDGVLV